MFEVVKSHKRLWIREVETGELVYTPPNHVNLPGRDPLIQLASSMTKYDINLIAEFEDSYSKRKKK